MTDKRMGIGCRGRNESVEFYRCALMFGIVLFHCITMGGHYRPRLDNFLLACVDGFVFISGYYGIKLRPSKLIRLVMVGIWCALVSIGIQLVVHGNLSWGIGCQYWFLYAYIVLMLFAPMINLPFESGKGIVSGVMPLLILVFVWSYLVENTFIASLMPSPPPRGFGAYSFLTLMGVYLCGRICRMKAVGAFLSRQSVWPMLVVISLLIGYFKPLVYNNIFAVLLSSAIFFALLKVTLPRWVGKAALFVAPSTFPIYLLHTNCTGYGIINMIESRLLYAGLDGVGYIFAVSVTAIIVFLSGLLIDCSRRVLLRIIKKPKERVERCVDDLYDRVVDRLELALRDK